MTDPNSGQNVFHNDLASPEQRAQAPSPWETDLPAADGAPIAEGAQQSQPAGYYAATHPTTSGGDAVVDFVPSSTGGAYQAASERSGAPFMATPQIGPPPGNNASWFEFKKYQQYFDIDTIDVGKRILGALIFRKSLFNEIEQHPDLYGPFWLSTTAIFMMAMISNALDFFAYNDSEEAWEGDLEKIASASSILYGYVFGGGFLLWVWLKVISGAAISLSALWCMYGYSMAIWLPVSCVAVFPNPLWLWVLCFGASLYSGVFLVLNLQEPVKQSLVPVKQVPTLGAIFGLHQVVALLLRTYVFTYNVDNSPTADI